MLRTLRSPCLVIAALSSGVIGCPASLPSGATALDKIEVKGAQSVPESDLLDAIASDPTHKVLGLVRMWWVEYGVYDGTLVEKDIKRIERYYRARGYYEAQVRAGRVVRTGAREVRVQIVVEEGPKVTVERVQSGGIDQLPEDVRTAVKAAWTLPPGEIFDEMLYHRSGRAIEQALTDHGYAHATVRVAADVDLVRHTAIVHVEADPGPRCTFGPVKITGLDETPEAPVRRAIDIAEGDPYSTKSIRYAQQALFDLGVFDSALILPDLTDPQATVIPLTATVTESKLRRIRAGPGFLLDPLRNDVHVTASWENRNFLGGLRTFKYEIRPLLMLKPGLTSVQTVRPGFSTTADLRQPGFVEARTNGLVGASFGVLPDPVNDFRMISTRGSVGVDRRFGPLIYAGLFYRKGFDFPTPYGDAQLPPNVYDARIGYIELLPAVDARDDILRTHSGYYASASIQYAFASKALYGGDFGDVRFQPEIRLFGPMSRGVTLAFRFMAGFLLPRNYSVHSPARRTPDATNPSSFADDNAGDAPLWRTFFSGGATSNRGYPVRSVGLRDCAVRADGSREVGADCSQVIGGATVWEGSVEIRFDIAGDLSGALFLDASDVSRNRFDVRLDYPHLSTGAGLRYFTPVGPIRMDFGWRIPGAQRIGASLDPREAPRELDFLVKGPFALHLSIGEAF